MKSPILIAETPNAAHLNHRFLVTPGAGVIGSEAADYVARFHSSGTGIGSDFLGVVSEVVQRATGRPAKEVLLLAGVDTDRLSEVERRDILNQLSSLLPDLDKVVQATDWFANAQLVQEVPKLAEWLSPAWRELPSAPPRTAAGKNSGQSLRPKSGLMATGTGRTKCWVIIMGLIFGLSVIALILHSALSDGFWQACDRKTSSTSKPTCDEGDPPIPKVDPRETQRAKVRADMKGQIDPRELLQKLQHVDVEPDPELNNEVEDYAVEWLQKKVDNCVTSSESTDWDEIMRILNSFDDKNYVGVTKKNGFSKIKPQFTQGRDHFRYDSLHRQWSDYLIWLKDHPFDYKAVPIAEKELLKTLNTWPGSDDVVTHYKKVKEYLENRKNGVSLHISMIKLKEMVIPLGSDVDVTVVMVTANSAAPVQLGTFRARGGESVFERDAIMSAKCSAEILAQMVSLEFHLEWGKFFPGKKMLTFKLDHQTLASLAREDFQRRKPVPLLSAESKTVELTVECAMTPLPPQLPQPADLRAQIGGRK